MPGDVRQPGRRLRVAIFGAGKMGMRHAGAIRTLPNAELVAIADQAVDPEIGTTDVGKGVKMFRSPSELLDCVETDVVHVCTPPRTHVLLAELAVEKGAHVYVEKPFALSADDAKRLLALGEKKGRKLCAGHQLLFEMPATDAEKQLAKIGRIVHVESYFSFRPVRRSPDGRGVMPPIDQLLDILPHPVYLLLHFLELGLPQRRVAPVELQGLEIRASGSVHGILRCGDVTGALAVTLHGRPVDSFVRIVGTNGSLFADFVRGVTIALPGPGTSGISKVLNPYSQAWQIAARSTRALARRATRKQRSYPGLLEIIGAFYESIEKNGTVVPGTRSIVETVRVCETVGDRLRTLEAEENKSAEAELNRLEAYLSPPEPGRDHVLVTGGTGMLGKAVAAELRKRGWPTRVLARRIPPASKRIPGVEYVAADLGKTISPDLLKGVFVVVHCAAETAGGKEAHARNSIGATRNILAAMAKSGVAKFVHVSSIAVLRSSGETGKPVSEGTPLLQNGEERGPYVWGKLESESLACSLGKELRIDVKVLRPGPLVDYDEFEAPGRLGREVGRCFVVVGSRSTRISLCEVRTAAEVIRGYVENFEFMPAVLNLVEPDSPTRGDLVSRLLKERPDLWALGLPSWILRTVSPPLKILQRLLFPGRAAVDIYSSFASETYDTSLAALTIHRARATREGEERNHPHA